MKIMTGLLAIAYVAILAGCAHPITISPNMNNIDRKDARQSDRNAGYYISAEDRYKEVTTAGGGGDKIRYTPYKDLEPPLHKVLINTFKNAYRMPAPNDSAYISENNISFIFIPKIETRSSSSGVLTWMATDFTVTLDIKALDKDGNEVWNKTISEDGHAEFKELMEDFQLSSRRASEKVFKRLQSEISQNNDFY